MTVKWTITDPSVPTTYTFHVNPGIGQANADPPYAKNVSADWGATPLSTQGATIQFQQDLPMQGSFEGTLLEAGQYNAFVAYWLVDHPVVLTDDLGRTFNIYVTEFQPVRVRQASNDLYHTYTVRFYYTDFAPLGGFPAGSPGTGGGGTTPTLVHSYLSDSAAVSDRINDHRGFSISDGAAAADSLGFAGRPHARTLGDNAAAADSLHESRGKALFDNAAAADAIKSRGFGRSASDGAAAVDALFVSLTTAHTALRPLRDTAAAIDLLSRNYDEVVLADKPAAYWKLTEAALSATVADATGNGFTGTTVGSPTLGDSSIPAGLTGTSCAFAGDAASSTSAKFTIAPSGTLLAALQNHDFSVEMWLYESSSMTSAQYTAFNAGNGYALDQTFQFQMNGNALYFGLFSDDWNTGKTLTTNAWHHVVFTFSAATKQGHCYVDGADIGTVHTFTGDLNVNSSAWAIGGSANYWHSWFGKLSRVAVYNKVLSASQVAGHYVAG